MNKAQEQEKIDRAIKDAEMSLKAICSKLEATEKEIQHLTSLEKQLEENLRFLKKKNVVAMAQEYKKAKQEYQKGKNRLAFLRIDRDNLSKGKAHGEIYINKLKSALAELLKFGENNVIHRKFGKSDG